MWQNIYSTAKVPELHDSSTNSDMMTNLVGIVCLLKWFISLKPLLTFFSAFEKLKVASNYSFGLINSIIYLVLALQKLGFYGEVLTTLYFTIMQPLVSWSDLRQAQFKKEQQEFVARKLDGKGWQSIFLLALFGGWPWFIYQSIGANRPLLKRRTKNDPRPLCLVKSR